MDVVVPCAQLRVFVPVDTLGPEERARWAPEHALGHRAARRAEDAVARLRLVTGGGHVPDDAVLVRRQGATQFVCPLQYDVRAAAGLRVLEDEVPDQVVDLLLPDGGLRSRLDAVAATVSVRTIIDAPWAVPLPWFTLFDASERRLLDPPEGTGPRLLHLTTVAAALERIERVDAALALVDGADDVEQEVDDLAVWLGGFDDRSLLELDYAGLGRLLGAERLRADRSVHEVWSAIEGLETGDLLAAVAYYGALRGRWSDLRVRPNAS